ncbi:hypothetical protein KQI10_01375, partial [Pseudoflavonifractor sp. MSJ-30]|uniref:hypothetical protein n=1 Tax=Pseudoflavonifractor sp. MSJ-30 TaxID=2841525 RepID=UPI001C129260
QFKNWLQPYDFAPQSQPSSPASATKIIPDFLQKFGIFLTFMTILPRPQIHFGDSLGIAQNHGVGKSELFERKEKSAIHAAAALNDPAVNLNHVISCNPNHSAILL